MPSLAQSLPTNDIGFLRIVASLWGLELTSSDPAEAAVELAENLCDAELLEEVVSTLPKEGRSALAALVAENGRMPWVAFARRFGDLREMGPGKRDREQPQLAPSSAAEVLWYRALLAKAFFNPEKNIRDRSVEKGPQEFAFIPDDLYMVLEFSEALSEPMREAQAAYTEKSENDFSERTEVPIHPGLVLDALGRPASPAEKAVLIPASDRILDEACSHLAAHRMGIDMPEMRMPADIMVEFLQIAGLLTGSTLNPEAVKTFLEAPREKALASLRDGWQFSEKFNELRQLPGLLFDGGWSNQPLVTREFLLNVLDSVPDGQWWSMTAFVRDIKVRYPDFQRPAGDYDTWFIKRQFDNVYLRGFSNWDEIDGALIRYIITGPLYWLGLVDLATPDDSATITAFRVQEQVPSSLVSRPVIEENAKLTITSQGKIVIPCLVSRAARYQIARFCEWDNPKEQEYVYRVTANSLKRAREQGLKAEHLLSLLRKHTSSTLPPPFVKALQRWEQNGTEARVENLLVLKVARPEVLNELRSSKAGRFLGEIVGPTTVVIQPGAQAKIMAALAELGILAEG